MEEACKTRFTKMHGLGNDFAIFDTRDQPISMDGALASQLANRHTGIGCDQLILIEPSLSADIFMRIYNADGGEVEACGNATRAVALLLGGDISIETTGGILSASATARGASVNMGAPRFDWDQMPLAYPMDTAALPLAWDNLSSPACINIGNPHAIFFVDDVDAVALDDLGPCIEHDAVFPERVNVNIAQITAPNALKLRVWERGAGLTLACGTGACATAVAAIRARKVTSPVAVTLPGGILEIEWAEGSDIIMRGDAALVYIGTINLVQFAAAYR